MNELKGKLNDMDYDPADLINTTIVTVNSKDSQDSTVCKAKNLTSDID